MNNEFDNTPGARDDRSIRDGYRSVATESTPPELDRRVLEQARDAARPTGMRAFFGSWQRPLAFAATVGLSLAILLEINEESMRNLPATDAATTSPVEEHAAGATGTVEVDPFAAEADAAARRMQDLEAAAGTALQRSADEERFATDDAAVCDTEVTGDPDLWWRCIDALFEAERTAAAEAELVRLLAAFPDFSPPR